MGERWQARVGMELSICGMPDTGEHKQTLTEHTNDVWSVAFSPDGNTLASGHVDYTARLWDVGTGEHKKMLAGHWSYTDEGIQRWGGHGLEVYSVAFSPDGSILASGSVDSLVILWEVLTGEYKQILSGHQGIIYSVAFSLGWNYAGKWEWGTAQ